MAVYNERLTVSSTTSVTMQYAAVLFVCAVAGGVVRGEDECMPPKPGDKMVHHGDCCKVKQFMPEQFMANAKKCFEKFPPPPKPTGPPPSGGPPAEVRSKFACLGECIFSENSLLTSDKQLDEEAVRKTYVTSDADLGPVLMAALDKCLGSYKSIIDQELECTSGAEEFKMCVSKEVFLQCPTALWQDSSECSELKEKTTKCSHMPVMLGMKPPHHNH